MYDQSSAIDQSATFEFISLIASDQSFCIELNRIREIRRWEPITILPHSPAFVLGVVNLRGAVVPIIDLASKLGFKGLQPTMRNVIIISNYGNKVIGFLVESVSEILTVQQSEVRETPSLRDDSANSVVRGVISTGNSMTRVIDIDVMMQEGASSEDE